MAKKNKIQEKELNYNIILSDIKWSYSSVASYVKCPKCFYLQYIKCMKSSGGFFGEYGSFMHTILEKYAKKEMEVFELSKYYKDNFNTMVINPAPPNKFVNLKEKYFKLGLDFFDNFEGYDNLNIVGVENKYDFKIGEYDFTGLIDLETTKDIIDYKTKGELHIKKLTKKHNKEDYIQLDDGRYINFEDIIQLLLYCIPYRTKHNKYPENIILDMIKINDRYIIKFKEELLIRAIEWVNNVIGEIYEAKHFEVNKDLGEFWCNFVCSSRYNCSNSQRFIEE